MSRADKELLLLAQAGDRKAFEELVIKHQRLIFTLVYRITMDVEEARDIVQETFLRAYSSLPRLKPELNVRAWLSRVATNLAIDHIRRRQRWWAVRTQQEQESVSRQHRQAHMERRHSKDMELREALRAALVQLSKQQRAVFVLKHCQGLRISEIADELDCSEGTVKTHLFRALRSLRELLRDYV